MASQTANEPIRPTPNPAVPVREKVNDEGKEEEELTGQDEDDLEQVINAADEKCEEEQGEAQEEEDDSIVPKQMRDPGHQQPKTEKSMTSFT